MVTSLCLSLLLLLVGSGIIEAQVATVSMEQSEYTALGEGGAVEVCVVLNGTIDRNITVTFATEDGTAVSESNPGSLVADYVPEAMNLTFQPSLQTSVMLCIIIQTLEDSVAEGPESFTAGILLQPGETDVMEGSPNPATVNIPGHSCVLAGFTSCCEPDNDPQCNLDGGCWCDRICHNAPDCCADILAVPCYSEGVAIEEEYYTIDENGTGSVEVCVTPIGLTTATASVTLATMDGSAVSGDPDPDYLPLLLNLTLRNSTDIKCVYISIFNDDLLESTEYFSVTITLIPEESDNVTVSNGQAEIYIIDDELPAIQLALTPSSGLTTVYPEDATITCTATGFPVASITWWRMGTQLEQSASFDIREVSVDEMNVMSTLTVISAMPDDSGTYTCRAGNDIYIDSVEGSVVLTVLEPCQPDVSGGIFWLETIPSEIAVQPCSEAGPFYRDGPVATRQCNGTGEWEEAVFTGCTLTDTVSDPFLLLWLVIEAEEIENTTFLEVELARILTENNVSFTTVSLASMYVASSSFTFEVELNSSTDDQSVVNEFTEYFNSELDALGDYNVSEGGKGSLNIVLSGSCKCQKSEISNVLELCTGAAISPCDCPDGQCTCQDPFVGDGISCTMDSDGDGIPNVPLESCADDSNETYCVQDICPDISNPDQNPLACQPEPNVTVGCPYGPDSEWNITWANTDRGENDTQRCPGGVDITSGMASRRCGDDGVWDEPNVLECQSLEFVEITESLSQFNNDLSMEDMAAISLDITEKLKEATTPAPTSLLPLDLNSTNFVISSLLDISQESNFTLDVGTVGGVFDNVLDDTNSNGWSQLQMSGSGSQSLLDNAERYGLLAASRLNSTDDDVVFPGSNIVFRAQQYNLTSNESLEFPQGEDLVNFTQQGMPPARIEIPREVVEERLGGESQRRRNDLQPDTVPVVNMLFRNIADFLPNSSSQDLQSSRGSSVVISSQVGNQRGTQMFTDNPVKLYFAVETAVNTRWVIHIQVEGTASYSCVYWNFSMPVGSGSWTSKGIETINAATNGTVTSVECESTHLTSFAVLVDVAGGGQGISEDEGKALQVISYVGCSISVVSLTITVVFFLLEGKKLLGTMVHHFIHLNLALALLLGYLLFLVGIETATGSTGGCAFVAALLHYFFLSAFCWMLCEGIMLYLMLVLVFSTLPKKWWMFLLIGWGTPVPIVVIAAGARHDYYGVRIDGELEFCWLSPDKGTIWAFVAPMLVIIVLNVVFLGFALRALWRSKTGQVAYKADSTVDVRELAKALLRATLILLPLLGLTWVFGILTLDANTTVFAWLFAILNSLQGLLFLIFHVIRSDKVWSKITPVLSTIREKALGSIYRKEHGVSSTAAAGTSSTMLKRTLERPNASKETGTLSSDSKSKEAGFFSISRSPTSAADESHIELNVYSNLSTDESVAQQLEETKPHPHPELSCVVPIEDEAKPHPHPEPSAVAPTEEEVKPCPPPEPSVTEEGVKQHPHPEQSIAMAAEKEAKPECETEAKELEEQSTMAPAEEVKPHPHPDQSTMAPAEEVKPHPHPNQSTMAPAEEGRTYPNATSTAVVAAFLYSQRKAVVVEEEVKPHPEQSTN